jgi:cellulose synthase/poly-beta-1,6-N-acetylglucosamine synthase-like glycosyltransferase
MSAVIFWGCVLLIVYTYAGYPLLLAAAARIVRGLHKKKWSPAAVPTVTVLIAAYNEAEVIAKKLENTLALNYPRELLQILVAADGSDDGTDEIVRSFANRGVELSYIPERQGKMAAINRAMQQARGEIVVFSDANNAYEVHTLRALVAPFNDPGVGMVTGAKHILRGGGSLGSSEGLYWRYESFIQTRESRLGCCTGAAGEIMAIRRGLYTPPPPKIINDDANIALSVIRAGYRVVYAREARSFETVSMTAQDEIRRRTRIIAGRYQLISMAGKLLPWNRPVVVWQFFSHKILRPLVPFAMLGALLANLAAVIVPAPAGPAAWLRLAPPYALVFLGLQGLFYLLAAIGNWVDQKKMRKLLYLPTFLVNSNLAALYGFISFISGKQTVLWERVRRQDETE